MTTQDTLSEPLADATFSTELEKVYAPAAIEERWSGFWMKHQISRAPDFQLDDQRFENSPFSVVIPPPNVTGTLHLGHALNNTLQDILVRTRRMQGHPTLWVFGTDHAGIATQNVVERLLAAKDQTRHDLGRAQFVERVWKWREESGGIITHQLKKLGSSLDWSRERFTLDEGLSKAVREVFVRLYEEKLLYRDQRLIHWCPRCQTALSDLEVEHHEIRGHLWHFTYLKEGDVQQGITVATTRPETLLGDTAIAVNPEDPRYKNWIGKTVVVPFVNRLIPVVGDSAVDPTFGTGAVKVTPAHDFNDFELGKRHNLERITVFTKDGRMNENSGPFEGHDRDNCRREIVKALDEMGQLVKVDDYPTSVGHCYRCKTVVEPSLSVQWFMKMQPLAAPALEAVKKGEIEFFPKHWEKTYFSWIENIKDWCVSRQIWWGHQIPAWYCGNGHVTVMRETPRHCAVCHQKELVQDSDVLDTWFSSALWPFSTLGWPEETELFKAYYPTSVLVTSFDIIFFWVARMIMMGLHFTGKVPFKQVYIHALVRDAEGQKMSKSKGNIVNPLEVMEKFGTDALRFTLAALAAQGRDIRLSEDRVEGYRNFCNKIWNAARFLYGLALPEISDFSEIRNASAKSPEDHWIEAKLSDCIDSVKYGIDAFLFNEAALAIYQFVWHSFCDWYLEWIKDRLYQDGPTKKSTAAFALKIFEQTLRLLHPFMPFLTEELWQRLPKAEQNLATEPHVSSIALEPFPKSEKVLASNANAVSVIDDLIRLISAIRSIRTETGMPPKLEIPILLWVERSKYALLEEFSKTFEAPLKKLAKVKTIDFIDAKPDSASARALVQIRQIDLKLFIPLSGLIDLEKERLRQKKRLLKIEKEIEALQNKLARSDFLAHAPKELVDETRENLQLAQKTRLVFEEALKDLGE